MLVARRRIERLAADFGHLRPGQRWATRSSGPRSTPWSRRSTGVSDDRRVVMDVLDVLQDELKRRYKDDPSLSLR